MGAAFMYEGSIEHEGIEVTLMVSEYPIGAYETHEATVNRGTLEADNLNVSIQIE